MLAALLVVVAAGLVMQAVGNQRVAWLLAEAYFRPRARASSSRPILERPGRFRRFASS